MQILDSEIAKGIMNIITVELKRKIKFLEETQYKNKCPMPTGDDNLKMFNQAPEEHIISDR